MRCELIRESISARLDGEEPPLGDEVVEVHLRTCVACSAFATSSAQLHRRLRLSPAEAVPDLSESIVSSFGPDEQEDDSC